MKGTRVKVTYVAVDKDGRKPIMSASSFEDLRKGLDEYCGVENGSAECLGFEPYDSKYPDEYEGSYKYKNVIKMVGHEEEWVDEFRIYCIDYFPYTTYEVEF